MSDGSLKKAYLKFLQSSKKGPGGPTTVNGLSELEFAFNPKEYTVTKSAEWKRNSTKGAAQASPPEFVGPQPRSLSVEIFFDATAPDGRDVAKDVEALFACLVPLPGSIPKQKPLPPFVQFGWGSLVLFTAYVKSVNAKFTLFAPQGRPLRAVCQVTLEEVPNPAGNQNPTSGSRLPARSHTVVAGDSLASLAYGEYGDPTQWRLIATANRIDDPLRLRPGMRLVVPQVDDFAASR